MSFFLKKQLVITKLFIFGVSLIFLLIPLSARAASFDILTDTKTLKLGQQFKATVVINTRGEPINAVSGKINYSQDNLRLIKILEGGSAINFWVDKPTISDHPVAFSGITPGGFIGDNIKIFDLLFKTVAAGRTDINISEMAALLNNGLGTSTSVKMTALNLNISVATGLIVNEPDLIDNNPPEVFLPTVDRAKEIFDNQWFLVFATQDKESGIERYEVAESWTIFKNQDLRWKNAQSPYRLTDQSRRSNIFVMAVDKNNNFRLATLPRLHYLSSAQKISVGLLLLILILALAKKLWKKGRKI